MTADEAKKYGIVDKVLKSKKSLKKNVKSTKEQKIEIKNKKK